MSFVLFLITVIFMQSGSFEKFSLEGYFGHCVDFSWHNGTSLILKRLFMNDCRKTKCITFTEVNV